jgi:outer membrane protein assembly factor BamB
LLELAGWTQAESELAITWGRAASPLVVDDLCVLPWGTAVDPDDPNQGERSLIALDAATGDVRWTAGSDQISYASPIVMQIAGKRQIVSVNEKTVTGHQIEDGKVLWSFDWLGNSNSDANCTMAVPAGEDSFLIGKGYGGGSALVKVSTKDGLAFSAAAVWESNRVLKTKFTHACVDGDVAYALSDGSLQAVSLADGDRLWMQPRSARFGQGQILLVGDLIVAQSEMGDAVLLSANREKYEELFRLPALSSKTWNIPTVAGRHLLVRTDRQAICYLLPK